MSSLPVVEFGLPRGLDAPGLARWRLDSWLAASVPAGVLASARLLVSELVTNALMHGRGRIRLRAELSDDRLLVEVFDDGEGFTWESRTDHHDERGAGGWGLRLVEAESTRCGVSRDPTDVWFELDCGAPPRYDGASR